MGLFSSVLRRKRGVIVFIAAFMLPLFLVVAVTIDTFSKRHKTNRNLLESNLYLSGRSALNQFETLFNEIENRYLSAEYLYNLLMVDSQKRIDTIPDMFILDQDFQVVYPETAEDNSSYSYTQNKNWNADYRNYMGRAEEAEHTRRNYSSAVRYYQTSLDLAETTQQEALAIEGLARSYMTNKNYERATRYYQLLKNEYGKTENLGGHPYGITAPLQLYTIGKHIGNEFLSSDSILLIYQMILDGYWLINAASYYFFKGEYESILTNSTEFKDSRFERILKFNQFLGDYAIPAIKERSGFSTFNKTVDTKRVYIQTDNSRYLISFMEIQIPDNERVHWGGFRWNLDSIVARNIPTLLADLKEETGLELQLVNGNNTNLSTGETAVIPDDALTLSFGNIPLPWTLVAIQPGFIRLESDVRIQLIIYGFLVFIIIILMLFGVFVLLRDISRETDSMLLQTEFVHNVSHELKTPLSLIRLYGETLLLKEHLPETDRKEGLQIITKESERLSYMINNILDFSKIEMGRKEFDLKPGNLTEVVTSTLASYHYHFLKNGFNTDEDIDPDIPVVLFDKNALEGILINLFSNAIKFSNNIRAMTVRVKKMPEAICLVVADKGIGIPPDALPNIFNRFYRVKSTSDSEARGSGLGLTLVKHAVDAHGWQIEVESTPGEGTVFSIYIPLHANEEEFL